MSENFDYNIILIDDETNILKLYSALLTKCGYHVFDFDNAPEAVEFIHKTNEKIDLIISDVNMPEMTGIQFLDHIKKNRKSSSIPLVFLSAVSDSGVHVDAFDSGAVDFIMKPVQKDLFLSKIRSLLKSYSMKLLKDSIYLEGSKQDTTIDEVVAICEAERITGFAFFYWEGQHGIMHFKGGMLEKIECGKATGVDAYEMINNWEEYKFIVAQGQFNGKLVQEFLNPGLQNGNHRNGETIPQNHANKTAAKGVVARTSFSGSNEVDTNIPETVHYNSLYKGVNQFTQSISNLLHQKAVSAVLEFTDQKILAILNNRDDTNTMLFQNKDAWLQFKRENGIR